MATVDRIEPGYRAWSPSAAGFAAPGEEYVGRHRRAGGRLALHRMFYTGRHRAR